MSRSIDQIIDDWWSLAVPNQRIPRGERLYYLIVLMETIKSEGLTREALTYNVKSKIEVLCVNQGWKDKKAKKSWEEMTRKDISRAESEVFGVAIEVDTAAVSAKVTAIKEREKKGQPAKKVSAEDIAGSATESDEVTDYKIWRPDLDNKDKDFSMEYIKGAFKFEEDFDLLDLEDDDE